MVHVNKMIVLFHCVSGSLLRCVYCTCLYRDDDENFIYRAALVRSFLVLIPVVSISSFGQLNMPAGYLMTSRACVFLSIQLTFLDLPYSM